ncbi:MAG: VOC family protein [Burkholderiales bacterium]|nr:VOC family protein [Burkholderiales bacterium]
MQPRRDGHFDVQKLNHFAWRCRDAEETRAFYEDVLGMPLAHVVRADTVPSTGEHCPYVHLFFRMRDGSFVAFFDLGDGRACAPDPATPGWVNHLSMEVGSIDELHAARRRLLDAGVEVIGVVDHHWLQSIYFHDPNGLRLELCHRTLGQEFLDRCAENAHGELARWTADKRSARAEARP